jgi:hypothetical protein
MRKWLKFVGLSAVVVLSVIALASVALAQGPGSDNVPPVGPVDQDGDGICDLCGQQVESGLMRGRRFAQDDDSGWPSWQQPQGNGFVDEDGDGICDLCGEECDTAPIQRQWFDRNSRQTWQGRAENGQLLSDSFVDEDGDGICDNHETLLSGRGPMGGGRSGGWMSGQPGR